MNGERRYLGVDVGGTTAKYAVITNSGMVSDNGAFPTGRQMTREEFLHNLIAVVDDVISDIAGVGICTLGVVDSKTGEILGGVENLPLLNGLNLRQVLSERYPGIPVRVLNDVRSAACGEAWVGAARDCKNFFCLTLGTGLGGCAVVDGQVVDGAHHRAGEICYLDYSGSKSYCERSLSTQYVMEEAARVLGCEKLDGKTFFDLVRKDDPVCQTILSGWTGRIARLIANVVILLDPELVLLGGGVSGEGELLLRPIREKLPEMLPPEFRSQAHVIVAACANQAGILGAVSGFMREAAQPK